MELGELLSHTTTGSGPGVKQNITRVQSRAQLGRAAEGDKC